MNRKFKKGFAIFTAVLAIAAGVLYAGTIRTANAGWWPDRPLKAYSDGVAGFDQATFNSFTGTSVYGFEPTFFTSKNLTTEPNGAPFHEAPSQVKDGDVVSFRVYFHNGADESKNGENFDGPGVAKNTKVLAALPSGEGTSLTASAYISSSTTAQPVVADTAEVVSADGKAYKLQYIPGSAFLINNVHTSPHTLPDSLVTTGAVADPANKGALIGYNQMDGVVPGCFQYDGSIFFDAKVVAVEQPDNPDLTIVKKVSANGTDFVDANADNEALAVEQGDTVTYSIRIQNTGTATAKNVYVRDALPPGLDYVEGSQELRYTENGVLQTVTIPANEEGWMFTATGRPAWKPGFAAEFAPNTGVVFRFKAKVVDTAAAGIYNNVAYTRSDEVSEKLDNAKISVSSITNPQGAVIEKAKTAFNETQGVDATTVKAHAGDVIRYSLITKNSGDATQEDFIVEDNVSDILVYANVTDLGGATLDNGVLRWPATDIEANETITNTFKVTVKPTSEWPNGGDLLMTNVYGNQVDVPLESQPVGPVGVPEPQGGVSVLPKTGPAEVAVGLVLAVGVLFFLARKSRRQFIDSVLSKSSF